MSLDELVGNIRAEFESKPSSFPNNGFAKPTLAVHASIQELHVKNMIADWIRTNVGQITT